MTAGSPVSAKSQVTTKDLIIVCVCFQSELWNIFNEIYLVQKNADQMCRNIWHSVLHLDCNERWFLCISTNCFAFTYSFIFSNLQLCGVIVFAHWTPYVGSKTVIFSAILCVSRHLLSNNATPPFTVRVNISST